MWLKSGLTMVPLVIAVVTSLSVSGRLDAQAILIDRGPDPELLGGGVIGGLFVEHIPDAVSPLTVVTFTEPVTVGAITVFTTNLNGPLPGVGYPVGGTSQAVLNIFVGATLPFGANTLSGGPFGSASTTVSYVETATGIEITASGLEINLPATTYLIGITPILSFANNGQEFFLDAGSEGQTTFLNNPGGALFVPIFGTETINANILDLPTPYTGMAIRITSTGDDILKGDVNGDGSVNLLDVAPFVEAVSTGTFIPEADCNCDGAVNLLDISPFIAILTGG